MKMNSQLVNNQLIGDFEVKEANMQRYAEKAKEIA